jgi:predicted dithiol-disulfide oxidoreductase (DUF899 family)
MDHQTQAPQGCPSCSFLADHFDGAIWHLNQRDIAFVAASRTALAKIDAYKKRLGWNFPWVSSLGSDFNFDFGVSFDKTAAENSEITYNYTPKTSFPSEEAPGLSVFAKDDAGALYHTYSSYGRGLDMLLGAYHIMDLMPKGRDEDGLPWSMAWVRRHDQYGK